MSNIVLQPYEMLSMHFMLWFMIMSMCIVVFALDVFIALLCTTLAEATAVPFGRKHWRVCIHYQI